MGRELLASIPNRRQNLIINGDFELAQRGTAFVGLTSSNYALDRFIHGHTFISVDVQQSTDVPTFGQSGHKSSFSLEFSNTTTASPGVSDNFNVEHRLEGHEFRPIFGKFFALSFWVKATQAGTFNVSFRNGAADRSYVADVTINQPNIWEKKTVIVEHDVTGTWALDNTIGLRVSFAFSTGTNFQTSSTEQWLSGNFVSTPNQTNFAGSANTINIAQVMVNEGRVASQFQRSGRTFQEELAMSQRYFYRQNAEVSGDVSVGGVAWHGLLNVNNTWQMGRMPHPVKMRDIPAFSTGPLSSWFEHIPSVTSGAYSGSTIVAGTDTNGYALNGARTNTTVQPFEMRLRTPDGFVAFDAEL